MKTTLDLPDDLLIEAKAVAARRRTTLKALIENGLRREIGPVPEPDDFIEVDENGFPCLKRSGPARITSEQNYRMLGDDPVA